VSEIRQGQVYWLDLGPVSGSAPAERYPCVVVQNDVFNRSAISRAVVCLITSNLSPGQARGNVSLKKGEVGLTKASVVNVSQILTVDKADLVEFAGQVNGTVVAAVRDGLHLLFETL
jgi:mRNA interferase MazF